MKSVLKGPKYFVSTLAANVTIVFMIVLPFNACSEFQNYYGGDVSKIKSVEYDPVAGCIIEQAHKHNGQYYAGHYNNDAHGHNGLKADNICTLANCKDTGLHQHNGTHYAGHNNSCHDSNHHGNRRLS